MTASVAVEEKPSVDNLDFSEIVEIAGAPGEIRTHDLCLRRAALYPAELRVPAHGRNDPRADWIQPDRGVRKEVLPDADRRSAKGVPHHSRSGIFRRLVFAAVFSGNPSRLNPAEPTSPAPHIR